MGEQLATLPGLRPLNLPQPLCSSALPQICDRNMQKIDDAVQEAQFRALSGSLGRHVEPVTRLQPGLLPFPTPPWLSKAKVQRLKTCSPPNQVIQGWDVGILGSEAEGIPPMKVGPLNRMQSIPLSGP